MSKDKGKRSYNSKKRSRHFNTMWVIFPIIILAIIFALKGSESVRENVEIGVNVKKVTAGESNSGSALNNAIVELEAEDAGKVTGATVKGATGTAPFDTEEGDGNDTTADDNIVRSFDQITWTINTSIQLNSSSTNERNLYVEATIPEENKGLMHWDLDTMAWAKDTGRVSDDGLVLTASVTLKENAVSQSLFVVLDVEEASNGTEIKPEFKLWMEGNEVDETQEGYEALELTTSNSVVVSAKPEYNIKLVKNNSLLSKNVTVNFNDGNGEVTGNIYGYGILLQLYNTNTEKGIKGLEYPTGDITFDINTYFTAKESGKNYQDITDKVNIKLWNYMVAIGPDYKNPLYGEIQDRNMYFGSQSAYNGLILPYGELGEDRNNSIYNSGNINMEENGNTIKVTISDYDFDGIFPRYNYNYTENTAYVYGENVGCFSAGYFQIFVQDDEEEITGERTYSLTVYDSNMKINSSSGTTVTTQTVTDDDLITSSYVLSSLAVYDHSLDLMDNSTENRQGKLIKAKGQIVQVRGNIRQTGAQEATYIRTVDRLLKFDGDGFEVAEGINYSNFIVDSLKFKGWYVTKQDGTNWESQEEMNNADVEDLVLYTNKSDIPEGHICVGMYFESQGEDEDDKLTKDYPVIIVNLRVKNTAEIGETYSMVQDSDYWTSTLDRAIYTKTNGATDIQYPESVFTRHNAEYEKTVYDDEGNIVELHSATGGYWNGTVLGYNTGNTVRVIGADASISMTVTDMTSSGETKKYYDITENENEVSYKIIPALSFKSGQTKDDLSNVTVIVKDILPEGLTYVQDSVNSEYGNPTITKNSEDGTTTLIWEIYNCSVGETIEPITFKVRIDENTVSGTEYVNTAIIEPDEEKIGLVAPENRTATSAIEVQYLASERFYEETSTPVIERNGQIVYTVTYSNLTDLAISDFQLLNILPYSGDNLGSNFTGAYILDHIKVTQTTNGNEIANDNLTFYLTKEEEARTLTAKDTSIGTSDIWTEQTIGDTLGSNATAIALKGEVAANTKLVLEIVLNTEGNDAGQKYINNTLLQTSTEKDQVQTSSVTAQVVSRKITGTLWYDSNEDGIMDDGEKRGDSVEVILLDENGVQVATVNTDENGYYEFTKLSKGNYKVKINLENKLKITTKDVTSNKEITSRFNENNETDLIETLNSIESATINENNVNAGYYLKDSIVIVKYIDENTNQEIEEQTTLTGKAGKAYTTSAATIEDYVLKGNSGNTTGAYEEDTTITVEYYYEYNKQDVKVKVIWIDDDNQANFRPENVKILLKNGNETVGETTVSADNKTTGDDNIWTYTFEGVAKYDKNVNSIDYTVVQEEINANDLSYYTTEISGTTVTNTIKNIGTVTVKYVDYTTGKEISTATPVERTGVVGEPFDVTDLKKEIDGYQLVVIPQLTGTYTSLPQTIELQYAKKTNIIIKYLEKGTDSVLADQEKIPSCAGENYEIDTETYKKNIENYTFVEIAGDTQGEMTESGVVIKYYYAENTTAKVQHIDKNDGSIIEEQTINGYVGEMKSTTSINKDGYVLVEEPKDKNITLTKDEQIVKYYYAHISEGVIEKHIDIITNELLDSTVYEGKEGDTYSTSSKTINGYVLVEKDSNGNSKLPENSTGTMDKGVIEVNYYYIKEASVTVQYISKTENKKLTNDIVLNGVQNEEYTTEEKTFDGYELIAKPENATGKMEIIVNEDGTYNTNTTVTYYYKQISAGVIEKHIDILTGKELASQTHTGYVGDSYNIKAREFEEYNLVEKDDEGESALPTNAKGEMKKELIEVKYYYIPKASVKVEYIDKLSGEILNSDEIAGSVGDSYKTETKEFVNYDLIETPKNANGTMTKDQISVKYYYARKAEVEVLYIDKDTSKQLLDKVEISGHVGDSYKAEQKEIPYYNFVESTTNTEGKMTESKITVKYFYKKQIFNLKIEQWINNVTMNGENLGGTTVENLDKLIRVEVNKNKITSTDIRVTYKIRVTNTGEIEGQVGMLTENIPAGFTFYQEDNQIKWENIDGTLTTTDLKDEIVKPGEYKEIELVLRWNAKESNFGEMNSSVEISLASNPAGYEDSNKDDDSSSKASIIISLVTGLDSNDQRIAIRTATIVLIIFIIAIVVFKRRNKK